MHNHPSPNSSVDNGHQHHASHDHNYPSTSCRPNTRALSYRYGSRLAQHHQGRWTVVTSTPSNGKYSLPRSFTTHHGRRQLAATSITSNSPDDDDDGSSSSDDDDKDGDGSSNEDGADPDLDLCYIRNGFGSMVLHIGIGWKGASRGWTVCLLERGGLRGKLWWIRKTT